RPFRPHGSGARKGPDPAARPRPEPPRSRRSGGGLLPPNRLHAARKRAQAAAKEPRALRRAGDRRARRLRGVARARAARAEAAPGARKRLRGPPALHGPLRRLPPGRRGGRLRDGRPAAAARRGDADADRRGRPDRPVRHAAVLEPGDLRPPARLDRPLRRLRQAPGRPRRRCSSRCAWSSAGGSAVAKARPSPKDLLIAAVVLLVGRRRPRPRLRGRERIVPQGPPDRRAELVVLALLLGSAGCAAGFVAFYALDRLPNQTQLLGASLGLSLVLLAAALVVTAKRLVVSEELEHDYPAEEHVDEQLTIEQIVDESGDRVTRRRLLRLGAGAAGGALGAALITPAVSLGPVFDMDRFYGTPWRRGRRLVDERGRP